LLCEKVIQPTGRSYSADQSHPFGMADAVLQQVTRDTQRFGIKCSNLTTNRADREFLDSPRAITTELKKLAPPI
jgi:hypothetical protein